MRDDDRAIVRCDAVEIAVCDCHEHLARSARLFRNDAIRWRVRSETFRVEEIRRTLSRLTRAVQSWIACPRDIPLGFGDLAMFDANACGHDCRTLTFFDDPEVGGLS